MMDNIGDLTNLSYYCCISNFSFTFFSSSSFFKSLSLFFFCYIFIVTSFIISINVSFFLYLLYPLQINFTRRDLSPLLNTVNKTRSYNNIWMLKRINSEILTFENVIFSSKWENIFPFLSISLIHPKHKICVESFFFHFFSPSIPLLLARACSAFYLFWSIILLCAVFLSNNRRWYMFCYFFSL